MQFLFIGILAVIMLAFAAYAHRQLPAFTRGGANIATVRLVLLIVGGLFGWLGAAAYEAPLEQILRFCIGFGIVHVPAAVILFIKGQRGAGKS